jgi:hypothetical protein
MARSPEDLLNLMAVWLDTLILDWQQIEPYHLSTNNFWGNLKVGVVDPTLWSFSEVICDPDPDLIDQQRKELDEALQLIMKSGAEVRRDVPLTSMDELEMDGEDALEMIWGKHAVTYFSRPMTPGRQQS